MTSCAGGDPEAVAVRLWSASPAAATAAAMIVGSAMGEPLRTRTQRRPEGGGDAWGLEDRAREGEVEVKGLGLPGTANLKGEQGFKGLLGACWLCPGAQLLNGAFGSIAAVADSGGGLRVQQQGGYCCCGAPPA